MRFIRGVLLLLVVAVVGVLVYNYSSGYGWTLNPPDSTAGLDAERARERGAELAKKAAESAQTAAARTEDAVGEASLTAKIKAKMALDDLVKARTIDVDTDEGVVTLTGRVQSVQERDRALRIAKETAGISQVVDRLEIVK